MTEAEEWIRQANKSMGKSEETVRYVPMPPASLLIALFERGQALHSLPHLLLSLAQLQQGLARCVASLIHFVRLLYILVARKSVFFTPFVQQ